MLPPAVPGAWQLTLLQEAGGYRFALDAFLLADFVPPVPPGLVLDLGTGCGVVALLLARRFPWQRIMALELQTPLVAVARRNVRGNDLAHQVDLVQADARDLPALFPAGVFRMVVCNPPYRAVGSGRLNPNPEKAIARHELRLTLEQLLHACRHALAHRGILVMVYHPSRLAELCARLAQARLCLHRLRLVHSTPRAAASLVLLEARRGGRAPLTVLPPLFIYDADGCYTAEMQGIFQGRALRHADKGRQKTTHGHVPLGG